MNDDIKPSDRSASAEEAKLLLESEKRDRAMKCLEEIETILKSRNCKLDGVVIARTGVIKVNIECVAL